MKYYFTYVLGMKDKQNKKATMGTIMHRVLQVLADKKLAKDNKKKKLKNDDIQDFTFAECDDIELVTKVCFEYYAEQEKSLDLTDADLRTCTSWVYKALAYKKGALDPRNQNVFATEKFFDIEIKKDWAKYDYKIGDENISGYLSIKGTVDLIIQEDEKYFQVLDYKSGRRLDWATGKEKTQDDLQKDPQLLLYYYALKNLYPDWSFYVSIYYVNDGGLFDIVFDEKDYAKAENMLRQKFEYIKAVKLPKQISNDQQNWKCTKLCKFSEIDPESGKTICQHFHDMIKSKGIDAVTRDHANLKKITKYQDGGGRIAKD